MKEYQALAKLHGQLSMRLRDARDRRDFLFKQGDREKWRRWKGLADAFKISERLVFKAYVAAKEKKSENTDSIGKDRLHMAQQSDRL